CARDTFDSGFDYW
nr:immunoglobulin heavy chain junction region [Macaca mulatta]